MRNGAGRECRSGVPINGGAGQLVHRLTWFEPQRGDEQLREFFITALIDMGASLILQDKDGTYVCITSLPARWRLPAGSKPSDDTIFGPEIGQRKSSAQVTGLYAMDELLGKQVVAIINFPPKQVGPFLSEFLLTGFPTDEGVVLTALERPVPDGTRLA